MTDIATYLNSPTQQAVCYIGFFIEDLLERMVNCGLITTLEKYGFSFNFSTGILMAGKKEWELEELNKILDDKERIKP